MEEEDHFHEVGIGIVGVDGGVGAGDANLVFGENGGDVGDDAGLVVDREADVIRGDAFINVQEPALGVSGEEPPVGARAASARSEMTEEAVGPWPAPRP